MEGKKQEQSQAARPMFVMRDSPLDEQYEHSAFRKSSFIGIYHMVIVIQAIYFAAMMLIRFMNNQFYKDVRHLIKTFRLFYVIIQIVIFLGIFPFLIYGIMVLLHRGIIPQFIARCLKTLASVALFASLLYFRWNKPWPAAHFLFAAMQGMIMYMKMEAYYYTVTEYRRNASREKLARVADPAAREKERRKAQSLYEDAMTFNKFFYFLRAPTLVFQTEYPRTERFRLGYFIKKAIQSLIQLAFTYEVFVWWARPVLRKLDRISMGAAFVQLLCPVGLIVLNVFLAIFECILNCYAELARFGDREFYQDFWNSTNFDDWSRRWNKPVHEFLKRYLYTYAIETYKMSQIRAYVYTLVYSAVLHEFVLYMFFGISRPILSMVMLSQAPFIFLGSFLKRRDIGNMLIWTSVVVGMTTSFMPYLVVFHDSLPANPF